MNSKMGYISKKKWLVGIYIFVAVITLTFGELRAQCFQNQFDIDFIFNTIDTVLGDLLPTWYDYIDEYGQPQPGAWREVQCQTSPYFSGADNDCNGMYDSDHFDLLGAVLNGDNERVLGSLNPNDVQTLRNDFQYNKTVVESLQITIRNVKVQYGSLTGTTTITTGDKDVCVKLGGGVLTICVSQFVSDFEGVPTLWQLLEDQSPLLKEALVNLIAGYMLIGEQSGIDHLKSLFRVFIYTILRDVLPRILEDLKTDDIVIELDLNGTRVTITIYGSEIDRTVEEFVANFNCSKFRCHPQLLASNGDINRDGRTNYNSYILADMNRQSWMVNESIQNPPLQITVQPQSQTVSSGTPVSFSIQQTGGESGVPQMYKWEEIKIDDFSTIGSPIYSPQLTIDYPLPTSKPRYFTVTICDSLWTRRSAPAELVVTYTPLEVIEQPQSVYNLVPGEDSCELSVKVRGGYALPSYQWQKWDGSNWIDLAGKTQKTISFNPVQLEDGGLYRCVVTSGSEQVASQTAEITILNRIRFAQPLQGGGVYVGETFTFTPMIAGVPVGTLRYLWKFNDQVIEGAIGSTLTIENAQIEDMGYYTCVIYDDVYTIPSVPAFLEVAEHMQILAHPQSGRGILGYDYTFTVEVSGGLGGVHYQWYRDNVPVGPDSPVFLIYPLQETDAGTYWCYIYDARESLVSDTATLEVFPPFNFDIQPQGAKIYTGGSHTFQVAISGGFPPYSYQWKKNGIPIPGATDAVLELTNLQPSDSGIYTCFVTDQNAGAHSAPAVLQVANHLSFVQHPQSAAVYRGSTHTFRVVIDGGLGVIQYRWYRKVGAINLNLGVNSPILVLSNVQNDTAGNYFCEVEDEFNEVITSNIATLTVVEPLSFTKQPSDSYVFSGGDVSFQVTTIGGLGTITYQWYKDGVPIGTSSNTLTIQNAWYTDAGNYWCEATDVVKTTVSSVATLQVLRPLPADGFGIIVQLSGNQVVPPTGSTAYGLALGFIKPLENSDSYELSITGTHSISNVISMTINKAPVGSNGPVVFQGNPSNLSFYGVLENSVAAEITVGLYYILLTSSSYPNGEIRGQILLNAVQRELRINVQGDGTTEPPVGVYPYWDNEIETIIARPAEGWMFLRWEGDIDKADVTSPQIVLRMNQDRNITAVFTAIVPEGEGVPEGVPEGTLEGTVEGIVEGIVEGSVEGTPEGTSEGETWEGISEGTIEEGMLEGQPAEGIIEGEVEGSEGEIIVQHSADQNGDYIIQLGELLRVIQFFNSGGYHCAVAPEITEDGYVPGYAGAKTCRPHSADYNPQDWMISLGELLRIIQFFNTGGYHYCESGEDGYCPGYPRS